MHVSDKRGNKMFSLECQAYFAMRVAPFHMSDC